jgi:hypothetical protein
MPDKPIAVREFVGRWYLYWEDTQQTIASFHTQFEAYAARRAILKTYNPQNINI